MKKLKLFLLSFVLITSFLTSCTNDEPLVEEPNTEESESIITSLAELRTQFNAQGDVIPTQNPTGNIVFDFCFDFVYPLNLSYNNGTTVTVNSLEDLIGVLINSNDELYINGIEFPFDVEVYNDDNDAIEIETINNEDEFIELIEDCDFDDEFDCECFEDYNPVCVEVEAPDGETFLMTYPNACFAECDGFTEEDFAENCEEDYNCPGGIECFEFIFPLSIITDDGETITVNSQEELDNALYNAYYFDFVYPFEVALFDQAEVITINNEEEFEDLLEECFDDFDDCECDDDDFEPVCVIYEEEDGEVIQLVFPNECLAECAGFDDDDFVECEDDNGPSDCDEDDVAELLVECQFWTVLINNVEYTYVFSSDGTVTVSLANDSITSGTWEVDTNPIGEVGVVINTNSGNFTTAWLFFDCDDPDGPEVISTSEWMSDIESGCD